MNATAAAISRLRNHLVKIPYYDSDSENTTSIPLVDQDAVGSSGLTTTTAVLLGFIVALALAGNIALLASILSNSKLRSVLLNILFCNIALLNLVDTVVTVFTSLLFVSHPSWILGNIMCKLSAFTQNLMMMLMLMAITVMAIERALGLLYEGKEILTRSRVAILWSGLVVVAFCFTVPIFAPNIPVKPFEFRYLCNIDSQSPIGYTIAIIVVYFLCLNMQLCCFGIILNRKYRERSLPMRPQDYGEFIRQSRALHDYIHMCKIVLTLLIIYVLIQGPYIVLNFVLQISNSYEVNGNEEVFRVHDDVVISLTLLKFLHPLLMPICVFVCCGEMWAQFIRIVCCTKSGTARLGTGDADSIRGVVDGSNRRLGINVMTVLATPDGLHLKYPNGYEYASQNPPSINAQNNNHAVYAQDQVVPYTYTSVEKIDSRSAVDKGQGPGDSAKKRSKKKQISTAHQQKRWRH
ncbi:hypothetical protein QR680_002170 [Steinernema hermaphroditum]|uniref:G-protein coupled receptors family 1 profile domain-containing protein n=1 Tax=Steinernema hermaphroditum TaxID=289476 RepID=A0AA39H1L1_9BILA|nr:hypothetical protein QR680_002170 [Steinernema hermaphroditum]